MTSKMAWLGNESNRLIEAPKLDSQPAFVFAFHVRCDDTLCDLFAGVGVRPSNDGPTLRAWADQSLTSKLVKIELQSTFEAYSLSRFGHPINTCATGGPIDATFVLPRLDCFRPSVGLLDGFPWL